jgi:hypothetical protein
MAICDFRVVWVAESLDSHSNRIVMRLKTKARLRKAVDDQYHHNHGIMRYCMSLGKQPKWRSHRILALKAKALHGDMKLAKTRLPEPNPFFRNNSVHFPNSWAKKGCQTLRHEGLCATGTRAFQKAKHNRYRNKSQRRMGWVRHPGSKPP